MDNLRLEHFSAETHLLPFASTNAQQSSTPFSAAAPWASLLAAESLYPQPKLGMPSPDRSLCAWDAALHQKQGNPIDIAAFPQSAAAPSFRGQSPALQLKNGGALSVSKFGHLGAPLHSMRAGACTLSGDNAVSDFRKDDLHLAGLLVAVETGDDASPLASAAVQHPAAHACKTGPLQQSFVSFGWHGRDDSDSVFKENGNGAVEKAEHSMGLIESFKGGHYRAGGGGKGVMVKNEQEAGVTIASLEDGSIGLRLGKRMYYGDGGEEGNRRANGSGTCCSERGGKNGCNKNSGNVSCAATTTVANATSNAISVSAVSTNGGNTGTMMPMVAAAKSSGSIPSKKQRGSSSSAVVPMCQAEGCTADLSGAKEYHRRHKVCEWHSKASKAKVNNLEQRFCQQCSRFHILSAFDEGKRSCRRRLAGHNERRRKPPPEPLPFLSSGGFPYFADCRVNAALHEHPCFFQQGGSSLIPSSVDNAVLACQLGLAGFTQKESIGNYNALELHRLMQGLPPGGGPGVGVLDGGGTLMLTNGNHLALSTAPSMSTPASSSSVGILPHVSSEMAMSGRALSLLSASLGSPETMSISLGMTTSSIDQIFSDTRALTASRQQVAPKSTSCFSPGLGIASALRGLPLSHNRALNSLTSSSSGCSTELDQGEPPMSNFEGRSLFLMHSENSFQTLQDGENSYRGRPVLDLMQISPGSSHHHHQQSQPDLPYVDLHGLSIFKTQNIM